MLQLHTSVHINFALLSEPVLHSVGWSCKPDHPTPAWDSFKTMQDVMLTTIHAGSGSQDYKRFLIPLNFYSDKSAGVTGVHK